MKTFTIDHDQNITVYGSRTELEQVDRSGQEEFSTEEELAALAAAWPGARLSAIWSTLPGVQPVKRFKDHKTAIARIWRAIQSLQPPSGASAGSKPAQRPKRGKVGKTAKSAGTGARRRKPAPTARRNSKTAQVITMLQQPDGASLKAIMGATQWQAHSVRGFISGALGKKLGLKVRSFEREGERIYAL